MRRGWRKQLVHRFQASSSFQVLSNLITFAVDKARHEFRCNNYLQLSNILCFCMVWETFRWFEYCAESHEDVMSCANLFRHFADTVSVLLWKIQDSMRSWKFGCRYDFKEIFSVQWASYNGGEFSWSHFFLSIVDTCLVMNLTIL